MQSFHSCIHLHTAAKLSRDVFMTSVKRFCLPVFMDVRDYECRLLSRVSTHSFLTTTALLFVVT